MRVRGGRAWRRLVTRMALMLPLGLAGCITTPLEDRSWALVQTPHYDIVSSLGVKASEALARDVELYRRAVEYVVGRAIPPAPIRTRIYAFDGRSVERPFASGRESSYLRMRMRGDLIVLRGGKGWNDEAAPLLQLRYARRLFRGAGSLELPLWYDEGFPQLASTLQVHGDRADVGILREDHVRLLRQDSWIQVDRILSARDLEGWTSSEREMFEAESWALAHYLMIGKDPRKPSQQLSLYRARLREGDSLSEAAERAFGGLLTREVPRHIREGEFDSVTIKLRPPPKVTDTKKRAMSKGEVLGELGELSVAIGRTAQAKKYFEAATSAGGGPARSAAGIGVALALEEDWELSERQLGRAASIAPGDPFIRLDQGNAQLARARASADPEERARLADLAREHYRRSLALDGAIPEAHSMLAVSYLLQGQDPAAGIAHNDRARALLPASLEIRLERARLDLKRGNRTTARMQAVEVLSRARTRRVLEEALALVEQIDADDEERVEHSSAPSRR